ncbi:hypothetical protein ACNFU2_20615 [Chryseobacterium sp. PTM-20240506]|uniref:hypothetical protein n=1 Tax=unclassified Chryseobacterium TaxID=2593645 RepID=UPI00235973AD|nr:MULTISPECIES: hypothetical protein [unclassified Chryseobacterium]MDC8102992.1 hypothetical protein [Chryseobacterium sp. B21-037]MDQ1802540.1 hypothetical protein [Chryseobacterium sp. CKR4-1]
MEFDKMRDQLNVLFERLDFKTVSTLDNKDFRTLAHNFFIGINQLRDEGLTLNDDFIKFVNNKHIEYDHDDYGSDLIYKERMQDILSELTEFCSPPWFWNTPLEEYLAQKW